MHSIKEIVRLAEAGLNHSEIGRAVGVARKTVREYLRRARKNGLRFASLSEKSEGGIYALLFPDTADDKQEKGDAMLPDWVMVHQELRRKGVTKMLLWQEYQERVVDGYSYSQFCNLYRIFRKTLHPTMRQTHTAGEKMFVDFVGQTVPVQNPETGGIERAQIFVAVLGASSYSFACAVPSQDISSWILCHVKAFEFFGGVVRIVVPDNLKSAVTQSSWYEPELNSTYRDFAIHYGVAILPARPYKPRDKAKVEEAVQLVERWILAVLRHRTFFSLQELNTAIAKLLPRLNQKPFQKLPGSRESVFQSLERPVLRKLPIEPYEVATWKKCRVNIDYHVELLGHYYSVPHTLIHRELEARLTQHVVEIFYQGERVASHVRSRDAGHHTTVAEHMPKSHQRYLEWSPTRLIAWAGDAGPGTATVVQKILESRIIVEQGYRSCLGIMRLSKRYSKERLENACLRAVHFGAYSYRSIQSILEKNLDQAPLQKEGGPPMVNHPNIRGPHYFAPEEKTDTTTTAQEKGDSIC